MSSDNDRLFPAGDKLGDVADDDGLAENSATHNVTDGAIRRFPHFFEIELFNASFIRRDRSTLDSNLAGFDGLGSVNSDLIIRLVALLNRQVKVLDVQIQMGENELC